ncbi:MAG TPA: glycosyltransferase family A protein [Solirubrobacteraceae bacterium]|nr:glycosyltransferase family A protein [Solirubrobacteraceae bacterium]
MSAQRQHSRDTAAQPRIAVIIPCFNAGRLLTETLDSIREPEPVEVIIIDDGSTDPVTCELYPQLEARGYQVLRLATNSGAGVARNTGLAATTMPYVFNLDADDLLVPGVLTTMAALLDTHPEAAVCYGDYEEFGARQGVRRTAPTLDPFRVAYVNKWPGLGLFRRATLLAVGGWPTTRGYEDWELWMILAERGCQGVHTGGVVFRYRIGNRGAFGWGRQNHVAVYRGLKQRHPQLFSNLGTHRRRSDLPWVWKLAYPLLYAGGRPRLERTRQVVRRVVGTWSPGLRSTPSPASHHSTP